MDLYDEDWVARWLSRPLCCKYVAVVFRTVSIPNEVVQARPRTFIRWGLGYLTGGESEILGAWKTLDPALDVPHPVFAELHERGVESFQVLASRDAAEEVSVLLRDVPGSGDCGEHIITLQGRSLSESEAMRSLRPATRRAVLAADEVVEGINRRLKSALARRGAFLGDAEAMVFVADFLARADRRLYEPPQRRRGVVRSRAAPAGAALPA